MSDQLPGQEISRYSIALFRAMQGAALPAAVAIKRALASYTDAEAQKALSKELERMLTEVPGTEQSAIRQAIVLSQESPSGSERVKQMVNLIAYLTVSSVALHMNEESPPPTHP